MFVAGYVGTQHAFQVTDRILQSETIIQGIHPVVNYLGRYAILD